MCSAGLQIKERKAELELRKVHVKIEKNDINFSGETSRPHSFLRHSSFNRLEDKG